MTLRGLYSSSSFLDQMPFGPRSWMKDIPQDPVTLAMAAMSTASTVATGGTILGYTAFGLTAGWTSIAATFAFNAALGYALNALTPKPKAQTPAADRGYQVNGLAAAGPTATIYGETKVGGVVFYQETTTQDKYLHRCIALAGHEIDSIVSIYLNDELVTLDSNGYVIAPVKYYPDSTSLVRINTHLGTDTQAADSDLISESDGYWTADHRARGVAYIYARFEYDADAFPNGVPTVTAIIKGKKVYDPRTAATTYSNNAALCLRDYLVSANLADTSTEIDDNLFAAAANVCDEDVSLLITGIQKRYTTNGTFTSDASPNDVISNLLGSMGGMIWYSQGKWGCKAASWTTAVKTLNEDDLRSSLEIQTRRSRRDAFNKVSGIFRGPTSNYVETNYPTLSVPEFVTVDGGFETELEMSLPFVDTPQQAQRISKIALYRNREQLRISGSFGMEAMALTVGDIVNITNSRLGFSSKPFEVVEWRFGLSAEMTLEVSMTLQELSSAVFDWNADETTFETNNTNLLSPFDVPGVSVTLSQEYRIVNEHINNILVVNVGSAGTEARVDYVEVFYKRSTDSEYSVLGIGELGRFEILDIDVPLADDPTSITYEVRARAVNALGVKGSFTHQSRVIERDTTGPSAPTNLSKQLSGGTLFLNWDASPDLDLSFYRIYHSSNTSAALGNSQVVISKVARPATSVSYPAVSGKFFIVPYDKTGNAGSAASIIVSPSDLPVLGVTLTDTENPAFNGTKTNITKIASGTYAGHLQLTSYSSSGSTGTYEFDGYLDTSSVRTVRVSNEVTSIRHHTNATSGQVNWDDITSNWDTWPNNFDDWSDESQPMGDVAVALYVSSTDDDPSGTPTWSSWVVAAGEITGRAFKFKAELSNSAANVTPSVSVLKGTVEY